MKRFILSLIGLLAFANMTSYAQKDRKTLVVYFSATGTTARAARQIAAQTGGDLYEITPAQPYAAADLDWRNPKSRSSKEMQDPEARPALRGEKAAVENYETIYLGYPIWWDAAPRIIDSFIENHPALAGKKVFPFATSGSSRIEHSVEKLEKAYPNIDWQKGRLMNR